MIKTYFKYDTLQCQNMPSAPDNTDEKRIIRNTRVSMNLNTNVISGITDDSSVQFFVGGTAAAGGLLLLCIVILLAKHLVSILCNLDVRLFF